MKALLAPALALVLWSLVIWFVAMVTRVTTVVRLKMTMAEVRFPENLRSLPPPVRQFADNYNHLMEQPTIFYALVFIEGLSGHADGLNAGLAWAYVLIRFAHSLVQVTLNTVALRLPLFVVSSLVLVVMAVRQALAMA